MNPTIAEKKEKTLLARLSTAIKKADAGDTSTSGEIALVRWELRQFYRSLGMHP